MKMAFKKTSIQNKLLRVIQLISGTVVLLACVLFFTYEYVTFRQERMRELVAIGKIVATNSTAALAFDDRAAARETLNALQAETRITAACLYDRDGKLFASFPDHLSADAIPAAPGTGGFTFTSNSLEGFQMVTQGNQQLGTLFLRYSIEALYDRMKVYAALAIMIVLLSSALAYLLYIRLQKSISKPILALAKTAHAIADLQDFSVRAVKESEDEVGLFTDAFNQMLNQIEQQNAALSESSERLRAVLNSALSGVIVIDAQGDILDWNERAEKMFGWRKEEVMGKELARIIIPENFRQAHRNGMGHFLKTGNGPVLNQLLELTALRRNGSEFPVELSISALKTNDILTFCGFVTDITERKKAEEAIQTFNQKLEQMVIDRTAELEVSNKELESFSYSVSHDLRAPLRSIHGYVNILYEDYGTMMNDEGKRVIQTILRNGQRMGQLIDDLLAFSRLGRKELTKSHISMHDLAENVIDEHKRSAANGQVVFTLHPIPPARGDNATLRQVWVNLISNAVKYSKGKEKPTVEIGAIEEHQHITYYVKDNGAGFDMEYYNKLFGVFQRLHSMNEFEGTGVGLAIVQRIISKHGGKIWALAKVNEGATFYFTLSD
ncbi:MAG: PAS domain S-box protein [Chryseolinea sp.]